MQRIVCIICMQDIVCSGGVLKPFIWSGLYAAYWKGHHFWKGFSDCQWYKIICTIFNGSRKGCTDSSIPIGGSFIRPKKHVKDVIYTWKHMHFCLKCLKIEHIPHIKILDSEKVGHFEKKHIIVSKSEKDRKLIQTESREIMSNKKNHINS